jgi:hypothetical protein
MVNLYTKQDRALVEKAMKDHPDRRFVHQSLTDRHSVHQLKFVLQNISQAGRGDKNALSLIHLSLIHLSHSA